VVFDEGPELRFVDQRTFGGLSLHPLTPASGGLLPAPIGPHRPRPDGPGVLPGRRRRRDPSPRTELKRALLDQTAVSGIGNIYADEALWRVRLHGAGDGELTRAQAALC